MSKFEDFIDDMPSLAKGYCFVVAVVTTLTGAVYLLNKLF